jgi:hypothetical protein
VSDVPGDLSTYVDFASTYVELPRASRPEFSAQTLVRAGNTVPAIVGGSTGTRQPSRPPEVGHAVPDSDPAGRPGLVEACWQDEPAPGRPRRHLYRLTSAGLASATGALASAAERAAEQAAARAGTGKPRAGVRPGPAARGAVAGMTP